MTTKSFMVRLPEELVEQLDLIAKLEHWSRNTTVQEAIKEYIAKSGH